MITIWAAVAGGLAILALSVAPQFWGPVLFVVLTFLDALVDKLKES